MDDTPDAFSRPRASGTQTPSASALAPLAQLTAELARQGWGVVDGFMDAAQTRQLAIEARALWQAGAYRPAAIGRARTQQVRQTVRGDHVLWLDPATASTTQRGYLDTLETLRTALNRELMLGLFDFEGHFAIYPPGSYYRRHLDRHAGTQARLLTVTLYLNADWAPHDGGALRLYAPGVSGDDATQGIELAPYGGRLVCFLSGECVHEVLPTQRERISLTGWFRAREALRW